MRDHRLPADLLRVLLKAKTENTASLEKLISALRASEGVERTDTMVVLSTHTERTQVQVPELSEDPEQPPRRRRGRPRKKGLSRKGRGE